MEEEKKVVEKRLLMQRYRYGIFMRSGRRWKEEGDKKDEEKTLQEI